MILGGFMTRINEMWHFLGKVLPDLFWKIVIVVIAFFLAKVILAIISYYTSKQMNKYQHYSDVERGKRINTVYTLFRSISRYVIYFTFAALVFLVFGGSSEGLMGATGVVGLAVGFGAQSLIKDVVTGGFLMFENQFSVGDYIMVNGDEGYVEAIAMRVTYLRNNQGNQVIIPNGTISKVVNVTRGNSLATIDVRTQYETDTKQLIENLTELMQKYGVGNDKIIAPPEVLGIERFDIDYVGIRIICKTKPMMQWDVQREIRLLIKEYFDQNDLVMPYIKREI